MTVSNNIFSSVLTAILAAFFFSLAATVVPYYYGVGGTVFLLLSVRYVSTFIFASILNKSPKKAKSKSAHTRLILISLFQALFISSYMYSIKLIPLSPLAPPWLPPVSPGSPPDSPLAPSWMTPPWLRLGTLVP